jgi:penicillin G amidase
MPFRRRRRHRGSSSSSRSYDGDGRGHSPVVRSHDSDAPRHEDDVRSSYADDPADADSPARTPASGDESGEGRGRRRRSSSSRYRVSSVPLAIPGQAWSRMLRIGLWGLGALFVLALLGGGTLAAGLYWLNRSAPTLEGVQDLSALAARVEVVRDRNGVPHIFAGSATDAYIAQGYVHAQDRLAQMDMMRLVARGRLAEFVGRPGIASDRFMRGVDLVAQAEKSLAAMSPDARRALESYARGVNAFLEAPDTVLPLEFRIADRVPEPWTPVDSLLWGQVMALQLSGNWRDELTRLRLAARHRVDILGAMWPTWPADEATTLKTQAAGISPQAIDRLFAALPPSPVSPHASNGWIFSGARTTTSKPLLANDPHLQLGSPSVWYLMRMDAPGFRRVGASAPGVPGIVLGHNTRVAWGMTTTGADTFDLFIERLARDDATRYDTPEGPKPFEIRKHAITIKDEAEPLRFDVRWTRHGVVLADVAGQESEAAPAGHVLVLASTLFLEGNTTGEALLRMNAATNVETFLEAAASWRAPVQNMFVADTDGRIALAAAGALPKRKLGDGWQPNPGWNGEYDWDGLVETPDLPRAIDPESGFLMNANNRLAGDEGGPFITRDWDAPFRGLRLQAGLGDAQAQDLGNARTWQLDAVSTFAQAFMRKLEGWEPAEADARFYLSMLRDWDGDMLRSRPEPLIFNTWMRSLRNVALEALLGADASASGVAGREFPHLLLAAAANEGVLCERADCRAMLADSLRRASTALIQAYGQNRAGWRWGATHAAAFEHPVWSRVPYLRNWWRFSVASDGDNYTVNRGTAGARGSLVEFPHVHGASLRALYDLADLSRAQFIIAPGQSGHPLSAHWGDLAGLWANGRYVTIAGTRDEVRIDGRSLVLAPR